MRPSICIFWYLENYPKCAFKTHSIVELLYFSIFLINSIFTINLIVYIFSKISNLFCFYSKITICNLDLVICNDSRVFPYSVGGFLVSCKILYCIEFYKDRLSTLLGSCTLLYRKPISDKT